MILTRGFALDVFPDESLPGEHWRLFQPGNEKTHFVVTGMGLHPAKHEELLMAQRKVRTDPEILHDVIVDGINVYMREVLLGHGVLDHRRLEEWDRPGLG